MERTEPMNAREKQVWREMQDKFWTRFDKDHRAGYDDGEPQTTPDFNHYNGTD